MRLDWTDLAAAVAIVCILEGVMPFINPRGHAAHAGAHGESRGPVRCAYAGLLSMAVGLGILYWVRS